MVPLFRRYSWNALLFCSIFLLSLFIFRISDYYQSANTLSGQAVSALRDNSIHFSLDTYDSLDYSFLQELSGSFALIEPVESGLPIYRVVYSRDYFQVSEGRSFTDTDFSKGDRLFLCGSKAENIMQVSPFLIHKNEYSLLGLLKQEDTFEAMYGVFCTDGNIRNYQCATRLILIGRNVSCLERVYSAIQEYCSQKDVSINQVTMKSTKLSDVYHMNQVSFTLGLLIILFLCSSLFLILSFWLGQYDAFYRAYHLFAIPGLEGKIYVSLSFLLIGACFLAWLVNGCRFPFYSLCLSALLWGFMSLLLWLNILRKKWRTQNEEDFIRDFL